MAKVDTKVETASEEAVTKPEAIGTTSIDYASEYDVYSQGKKAPLTTPIEVTLLKDWGDHKEGDVLELTDQAVIAAGVQAGLFEA